MAHPSSLLDGIKEAIKVVIGEPVCVGALMVRSHTATVAGHNARLFRVLLLYPKPTNSMCLVSI